MATNKSKRLSFRPQLEVLEDRCLLATQLMGSFQLGLEDAVFWEGPTIRDQIFVPEIPELLPSEACESLGPEHPCWDWRIETTEPGQLRVALDMYPLEVRPWADPRPMRADGETAFAFEVFDPAMNRATKPNGDPAWASNCNVIGCGYSAELFVDAAETGTWTVRVIPFAVDDVGFRMRAKLEAEQQLPDEPTALYPNLRAIPAFEFTFATPSVTYSPAVDIPAGPPGCMPEEIVDPETGERPIGRACLRFSMGIENPGDGPLSVIGRVDTTEPGRISAYQQLFVACKDNSCPYWQEQPLGSAGELHLHPTHGHFHYEGIYSHRLFRVTDLRAGTLVQDGVGHKSGFFPADERMADWERFYQCPQFSGTEQPCNYPATTALAVLRLGTGWGDVYEYNRSGNYVDFPIDVTTLNPAGGYYVVQGITDEGNHLLETREDDNASYALIYVDGRNVYTCERGYGESPWDPNKVIARSMPTNDAPAGSSFCQSDLQVTNISAASDPESQGNNVTITATIANFGAAATAASQAEFLLDGRTVLAIVDTPAIPAGGTATVSISLNTKSLKGTHTIRVTADQTGVIAESDETNNSATLTLTIKGNQVQESGMSSQESEGSSEPPAEGASGSASGEFVAMLLVEEDAFASDDSSTASEPAESEPTSGSPASSVDAFFAAVANEEDSSLLFARPEQESLAGLLTDLISNPLLSTGL